MHALFRLGLDVGAALRRRDRRPLLPPGGDGSRAKGEEGRQTCSTVSHTNHSVGSSWSSGRALVKLQMVLVLKPLPKSLAFLLLCHPDAPGGLLEKDQSTTQAIFTRICGTYQALGAPGDQVGAIQALAMRAALVENQEEAGRKRWGQQTDRWWH